MYTYDELKERYAAQPRRMDQYLRKLTYTDTGESLPFPSVKLALLTLITAGGTYIYAEQTGSSLFFSGMVSFALYLGVAIQIVRSASISERNAKLISTAPLCMGRVVQGDNHLYREGVEPGKVTVVFSMSEAHCFDDLYLRDVAKRLRSAAASDTPPENLTDAVALVRNLDGKARKLPADVAADNETWVGLAHVQPDRLPEHKIVNQHLLILPAPQVNLVPHL